MLYNLLVFILLFVSAIFLVPVFLALVGVTLFVLGVLVVLISIPVYCVEQVKVWIRSFHK